MILVLAINSVTFLEWKPNLITVESFVYGIQFDGTVPVSLMCCGSKLVIIKDHWISVYKDHNLLITSSTTSRESSPKPKTTDIHFTTTTFNYLHKKEGGSLMEYFKS